MNETINGSVITIKKPNDVKNYTKMQEQFIEDQFEFKPTLQTPLTRKTIKKQDSLSIILNVVILALVIIIIYEIFILANHYFDMSNNEKATNMAHEIFANYAERAGENGVSDISSPDAENQDLKKNAILLNKLREGFLNEDICAYIKIENTTIDYPVVQGKDNDYYTKNGIFKKVNSVGAIFMDCENSLAFDDWNTVIYGNNMKNDLMFHDLYNYASPEFYKFNKYILIKTEEADMIWEIFSFYPADEDFNYTQTKFGNKNEFYELVKGMEKRSLYDTGVKTESDDIILTLVTYASKDKVMSYVVNARLAETIYR